MRLLQGEFFPEGLDEGVRVLDLETVHKPEGILGGDDDTLSLGGILVPAIAAQDILSVLDFRDDAVLFALEISGLRNVSVPKDLDLRRSLLLGICLGHK